MDNLTHNPETSRAAHETTGAPRSAAPPAANCTAAEAAKNAVSAENAVRHGLLARLAIMDVENRDAFLSLCTDMRESFEPTDEYEQCIVDTMTLSMWRRTRAMAMETSGLQVAYRKHRALAQTSAHQPNVCNFNDIHDVTFCGLVANPREQHVLDLLHRYESRHTRAFERALKCLVAYRNFRNAKPKAAEVPAPPQPNPENQNLPNDPEPVPTTQPGKQPESQIQPNEPDKPQVQPQSRPKQHPANSKKLNRRQRRELLRAQKQGADPKARPF
jgi:hypothetical protein